MKTVLRILLATLTVILLRTDTYAFRNCNFCGDDFISEEEAREYCTDGGFHHINRVVSNPSRDELVSSLYHSEGATITYSKVTAMFTSNKTDSCCVQYTDSDHESSYGCDHSYENKCKLTRPYIIVWLENLCIFKFNDFITRTDPYDPAPDTMTLKSPCPFDLALGDELIVKLDLVVPISYCPEWRFIAPSRGISDSSCVHHQKLFKATPESLKQTARLCGLHKPRTVGHMKYPYCPGVSQNLTSDT